ncbi:MAG TPA: antibiotic biosynthesis monooxygenase [Nitrospiria bacterium]|nr:antibiotic biosynthesis monooxygenase [Nitrospiria bacterium]HUK55588.1 antibiotic biosynthesis monooxygenase [Nitrospiria bacterium]
MIVVANRIPVVKGREQEFERQFLGRPKLADMMPGFIRNEFLKPLNNDYYVVLSYWESREEFEAWVKSEGYQKNQARKMNRDFLSGPVQMDLHEVIGISERVREM